MRYVASVGHYSSLYAPSEQDAMTDYFPGMWAIKTLKSLIKWAGEEIARGNTVTVEPDDSRDPDDIRRAKKVAAALAAINPAAVELKLSAPETVMS